MRIVWFCLASGLSCVAIAADEPATDSPFVKSPRAQVYVLSDMEAIRLSDRLPELYEGDDIVGYIFEGDSVTATRVSFKAGVKSPHHNHAGEEIISVISGRLRVIDGDETFDIGPGDSVRFPSHMPHQIEALEDTLIIESFGPPGNPGSPRNQPQE